MGWVDDLLERGNVCGLWLLIDCPVDSFSVGLQHGLDLLLPEFIVLLGAFLKGGGSFLLGFFILL